MRDVESAFRRHQISWCIHPIARTSRHLAAPIVLCLRNFSEASKDQHEILGLMAGFSRTNECCGDKPLRLATVKLLPGRLDGCSTGTWPNALVIINTEATSWTIAHEIAHAMGINHDERSGLMSRYVAAHSIGDLPVLDDASVEQVSKAIQTQA